MSDAAAKRSNLPAILVTTFVLIVAACALMNHLFMLGWHSHLGFWRTSAFFLIPAVILGFLSMGISVLPVKMKGVESQFSVFIIFVIMLWAVLMFMMFLGGIPLFFIHLIH